MFNINKEIARHICLAQVSSDAGKRIYILKMEGTRRAIEWGYTSKDKELIKAIELINSVKITETQFRYFVIEKPDQNGHKSRIVYFYDILNKLQISFHCFCGKIKAQKGKGVPMKWDKGNSRENCQKLIEIFNL